MGDGPGPPPVGAAGVGKQLRCFLRRPGERGLSCCRPSQLLPRRAPAAGVTPGNSRRRARAVLNLSDGGGKAAALGRANFFFFFFFFLASSS